MQPEQGVLQSLVDATAPIGHDGASDMLVEGVVGEDWRVYFDQTEDLVNSSNKGAICKECAAVKPQSIGTTPLPPLPSHLLVTTDHCILMGSAS